MILLNKISFIYCCRQDIEKKDGSLKKLQLQNDEAGMVILELREEIADKEKVRKRRVGEN